MNKNDKDRLKSIITKLNAANGKIRPLETSWDINYHIMRFNDESFCRNVFGAQHHLRMVIEYMSIKIMEDHCE